jgi:hypothetical protein
MRMERLIDTTITIKFPCHRSGTLCAGVASSSVATFAVRTEQHSYDRNHFRVTKWRKCVHKQNPSIVSSTPICGALRRLEVSFVDWECRTHLLLVSWLLSLPIRTPGLRAPKSTRLRMPAPRPRVDHKLSLIIITALHRTSTDFEAAATTDWFWGPLEMLYPQAN